VGLKRIRLEIYTVLTDGGAHRRGVAADEEIEKSDVTL
jgi:hypothetical protein